MTRTSLYRRVLVGALVAVVLAGVSLAASAALSPSGQAAAQQGQGGRYVALSSARLLDTRVTTPERPAAPLAGYQSIDVQVAGKGGVDILRQADMSTNDPRNRVLIRREGHQSLHTTAYHLDVEQRLERIQIQITS